MLETGTEMTVKSYNRGISKALYFVEIIFR